MGSSEVKAHSSSEERARALREELAQHDHRIHVLEHPVISAREYARLRQELEDLEVAGASVQLDSASLRRGGTVRTVFDVIAHRSPWPELPKVQSVAELRAYHARIAELEGTDPTYVASATIPGVDVELRYIRGVLDRAVTRGDGMRGEDLTDNVRTIGMVPLILRPPGTQASSRVTKLTREALGPSSISPVPPFPEELIVRGIVAMRIADITALDRRRVDSGEPPYISARGAVSCSLRRLDPRITASRRLSFFASGSLGLPANVDSEWQLFSALKSWGFAVLPVSWRCTGIGEVLDFIATLHQLAPSFDYPLEGGTLRLNHPPISAASEKVMPPPAVSLSFPAPGRPAVVSSVYFAVGRGGAVLPVAMIDRAPGHDLPVPERAPIPAESSELMLPVKKGTPIRVRPGSVAPIISIDRFEGGALSLEQCPVCTHPLKRANDEPFGRCESPSCRGRARARLLHLIGPRGLKLDSINVKVVDRLLVEPGILDAIDLMTLDPQVIEAISPGRGESFKNELSRARRLPLWRLLYLVAIPNVSEHSARAIAQFVFDVARLEKMAEKPSDEIPFVPLEASKSFARWLGSEGLRAIKRLKTAGFEILDATHAFPAPLLGRRIHVAGELEQLGNVHAMDEIERRGGVIVPALSRTTDFVIAGKNSGKAIESAKHYDVTVLEEIALSKLIQTT